MLDPCGSLDSSALLKIKGTYLVILLRKWEIMLACVCHVKFEHIFCMLNEVSVGLSGQ